MKYNKALKSLFLWLLPLYIFSLNAQSPTKAEFLADNLVDIISHHDFPDSSTFYINLQTRESDDLNLFFLQQRFLENSFIVVESEQFADCSISIRLEERVFPRRKDTFPRAEELFKETVFVVQVVQNIDTQVLEIKRLAIEEKYETQQRVSEKWYTPIMIVFVLGSLIYLLYYM